jgi:hypothetical protein
MKYVLAALLLLLPAMASAEEETLAKRCTSDDASSWRNAGDRKLFVYEVENTCDFRISCELNISILNTFGMTLDHKIITIEPKSHGNLVLWVKAFGGMSSRGHTCKQI